MIDRRTLLATVPSLLAAPSAIVLGPRPAAAAAIGDPAGFDRFLAGVRAEARRDGIAPATLDRALHGLTPNRCSTRPNSARFSRHAAFPAAIRCGVISRRW